MRSLILLVIWMQLFGCTSIQSNLDSSSSVYVLGTIHGNMLNNSNNTLRDFVSALYQYKPTLILTEVRPEHPNVVESIIDGGPEQVIVYSYAKENGFKIVPIDWFDDQYNFESAQEDLKLSSAAKAEIDSLFLKFREIVQKGSFLTSQDAQTQDNIRRRYDIMAEYGLTALRRRDQLICQNIKKHASEFANKRVLIIFGLAHKYSLDDCLQKSGIHPVTAESWFDPETVKTHKIPDAVKNSSIQAFESSKQLLSNRLQNGYYNSDLDDLKEKLEELDLWIKKTKAL